MGGKGSGGGTQSSYTGSTPPHYLMPFIGELLHLQNFLTTGSYNPNATPTTVAYPGPNQQIAGFTPDELAGFGLLEGASGLQSGLSGNAAGTANDILSGRYLNPASNPELTAYYNAAAQPLTNQYTAATAPSNMSQAALTGAFGGSADAENRALSNYGFGNQLSNLAANIYEPAYQQGLQQMTQTLGLSPSITANLNVPGETLTSVGGMEQQQNQAGLNAAYQNAYNRAMWPYELSSMLGSTFQNTGLGYGDTSGTTSMSGGGSKGGGIMGGLLGGAGLTSMMFPNFLPGLGSGISGGISALLPFLGM